MSDFLLAFPDDVHSIICGYLSLKELISLRKTCKNMDKMISGDKQLWIKILKFEVLAQHRPVAPYCLPLESADAPAVEAWVRTATLATRSLQHEKHHVPLVLRMIIRPTITLAKLIRGRFCLIASSDKFTSRLTVFDTQSGNGFECMGEFYLDGPVLDGEIDDDWSTIHFACTVNTSTPHIEIFSLGLTATGIELVRLSTIANASHIRLLRGHLIGYVVQDGDDSVARLLDWSNESLCIFDPEAHSRWLAITPMHLWNNEGNSDALGLYTHRTCLAMTIWKNHVLVVGDRLVDIYPLPDLQCNVKYTSQKPLVTLPLHVHPRAGVSEARFVHCQWHASTDLSRTFERLHSSDTLPVVWRSALGIVNMSNIRMEYHLGKPVFSSGEATLIPNGRESALRIQVGLAGAGLLWTATKSLDSSDLEASYSLRLNVAQILRRSSDVGISSYLGPQVTLAIPGLPMLDYLRQFDYDDARGIILLGTANGHICLINLIRPDNVLARGVMDSLPQLESPDPKLHVSQNPVNVDIPAFYECPRHIRGGIIPYNILTKLLPISWSQPSVHIDMPGWSNDWTRWTALKDWLSPGLRWDIVDDDLAFRQREGYSVPTQVLLRTGTLGTPIPVMYRRHNHRTVFFRVGERLHLYTVNDEGKDYFWIVSAPWRSLLTGNTATDIFDGQPPYILIRMNMTRQDNGFAQQLGGIVLKERLLKFISSKNPDFTETDAEAWTGADWYAQHKRLLEEEPKSGSDAESHDSESDGDEYVY